MPTYEYQCPAGHVTQRVQSMLDEIPAELSCMAELEPAVYCGEVAQRKYSPPAALHFKGSGFYATDVKGRYDRKRRKNAGDSLPLPAEAALSRAEGAEKDNDRRGFNQDGTIKRRAA